MVNAAVLINLHTDKVMSIVKCENIHDGFIVYFKTSPNGCTDVDKYVSTRIPRGLYRIKVKYCVLGTTV